MARGPNFVAHIDFLVDRPALDHKIIYQPVEIFTGLKKKFTTSLLAGITTLPATCLSKSFWNRALTCRLTTHLTYFDYFQLLMIEIRLEALVFRFALLFTKLEGMDAGSANSTVFLASLTAGSWKATLFKATLGFGF